VVAMPAVEVDVNSIWDREAVQVVHDPTDQTPEASGINSSERRTFCSGARRIQMPGCHRTQPWRSECLLHLMDYVKRRVCAPR
jgi:hypothetical protein